MANRVIPFGYGIENGVVMVVESEAEVVRNIFVEYANGKSLKEIAFELTQHKVPFYEDNCLWNKAKVLRILENEKYIGAQSYPAITNAEVFNKANSVKKAKGYKQTEQSELTEFLKSKMYCGNCGERLFSKSCSGGSDRWQCANRCKTYTISKDKAIGCFKSILETVKLNLKLLEVSDNEPTYTKTPEIVRYCNEIGMMTNDKQPSFAAVKKLILQCASVKFQACRENKAEVYTEYVCKQFKDTEDDELLNVEFLKKVVSKILLVARNKLAIMFVNGAIVEYGGTDGTK